MGECSSITKVQRACSTQARLAAPTAGASGDPDRVGHAASTWASANASLGTRSGRIDFLA